MKRVQGFCPLAHYTVRVSAMARLAHTGERPNAFLTSPFLKGHG